MSDDLWGFGDEPEFVDSEGGSYCWCCGFLDAAVVAAVPFHSAAARRPVQLHGIGLFLGLPTTSPACHHKQPAGTDPPPIFCCLSVVHAFPRPYLAPRPP